MKTPLKIAMASTLALSTAVPAMAQYYQPTQQYQRDYQNYQSARSNYEISRADYQAARAEYERRRADWERARADYDARYGYGAYARRYGSAPVWDTARWGAYDAGTYGSNASYASTDYSAARADYERRRADWDRARTDYDRRYGYGSYERRYGPAPVWDDARYGAYSSGAYGSSGAYNAGAYGANTAYSANTAYNGATTVRCNNNSTVTAGVIGAIAGAVLGSNVAARNARTEGAVLGAVVGGGVGAAVGRANDKYKCDTRGPYFTREDTVPYREAARSERFDYYTGRRCRLAPAPVDTAGQDYRYVRVCPDDQGRYRITG